MNKEPFKNLLLRFLRKCKISYQSVNTGILITGGRLRGLHIVPERTRCYVSTQKMRGDRIELDLLVEYSIEVLLYKLFKFRVIQEDLYADLLGLWHKE